MPTAATIIIVMGVAGSGKTTIGRELAAELGWQFLDADDFHPAANVAKMASGKPLDDADRAPWLRAIRARLESCAAQGVSAVLACSALKRRYRGKLIAKPQRTKIVFLNGARDQLLARLESRRGHFMKADMLDSQLATLEMPDRDEAGAVVSVEIGEDSPRVVCAAIRDALKV